MRGVTKIRGASKRRRAPVITTTAELNDPLHDLYNGNASSATTAHEPWEQEEVKHDHDDELHPHLLTPADALRFMTAGNATVTFRSKKTGTRFTYRVKASDDGNVHFVALLSGPNNEGDYTYLGYIRRGVFLFGSKKKQMTIKESAPSVQAFMWVWRQLQQRNDPSEVLEIWHEGRCGRCGRTLTVPESIERGIGPECASQMGM